MPSTIASGRVRRTSSSAPSASSSAMIDHGQRPGALGKPEPHQREAERRGPHAQHVRAQQRAAVPARIEHLPQPGAGVQEDALRGDQALCPDRLRGGRRAPRIEPPPASRVGEAQHQPDRSRSTDRTTTASPRLQEVVVQKEREQHARRDSVRYPVSSSSAHAGIAKNSGHAPAGRRRDVGTKSAHTRPVREQQLHVRSIAPRYASRYSANRMRNAAMRSPACWARREAAVPCGREPRHGAGGSAYQRRRAHALWAVSARDSQRGSLRPLDCSRAARVQLRASGCRRL